MAWLTKDNLANELEEYIDQHNIAEVIDALREICYGKSAHVLTNWQDKNLSRQWDRVANKLISAFNEAKELPQ
jgi:hypothetical protein